MSDQTNPLPPPRVVVETARVCYCLTDQGRPWEDCENCGGVGIVWDRRELPPIDAVTVEQVAIKMHAAYQLAYRGTWTWDRLTTKHRARWLPIAADSIDALLGEGVRTG